MLKLGAEAVITAVEWRGRPAVEKLRVPKGYRDPRLDDELRRARIRKEAKLFAEARAAGVPVPVLYDVDLAGHRLVMERIDGPTLKEVLRSPGDHGSLCEEIGRLVAKLHSSGLVHGDLTTSNMLRGNGRVHLIDLSLGEKTDGLEARGVDLRLLKEAFTSAHYDRPELFGAVARAYVEAFPAGAAVLQKMREIEERGRYM
ncbi:MAG TPA: KEOPS complex kinase/ATPase Bud32 [Thermoplasmata archaeon]|nr:KEOPS complex kinase/ATPase Bud32 [Thermoplasmata archaeon]